MWTSESWQDYELLDTSGGERLERWGKYLLVRPDPQVIWQTPRRHPGWKKFDARYIRSNKGGGHLNREESVYEKTWRRARWKLLERRNREKGKKRL